jgi:hypothetical protein
MNYWRTRTAMLSATVLTATAFALVAGAPAQAIAACQPITGSVIIGSHHR